MNISRVILDKGLVLFLKVFSLGIKFLFFSIILPKKMQIADYGDLSLLTTTITFFIYLVGFDFYNYAHRDFINDDKKKIVLKLFNQLFFNVALFALLFIPFYISIYYNNLPYALLAYTLLFTEYFGQELYRLLILFSKPILANVIMFFRSSLWIIVLLLINNYNSHSIDIFEILIYWLSGNMILVLICITYIFNSEFIKFKKLYIDKKWIKKGFFVSIPFLLSTITLKIIELSDRYIIGYFYSNIEVAIYSFYANISNSLNVIVNTAVVIMIYPKLLSAFKEKNKDSIKQLIKLYKKEMFIFLSISIPLLLLLLNPIINWIGKSEYATEVNTYVILLFANMFFNLSLIPHVILYALHKDSYIIRPVLYACIINLILNFLLLPRLGLIGAGISTFTSFFLIFIMKFSYVRRLKLDI